MGRYRRRWEIGFWDWLRWVLTKVFGDRDVAGRRS
jgi:hypothetical protein